MRPARLISLLALVAAATAGLLILTSSGSTYRITAVFQQAYGLIAGGRVVAGGAPVGEVQSVTLGSDGLPRVAMQIDDSYRLRQGATANLLEFSNSGELNRYVLLSSGSGAPLANGAVIRSSQTDQPVEFDQVLSTLDPATRSEVRSVLASFDSSSHGLSGAFRAALHHSAASFAAVASDLGQVTQDGFALRTLVSQSNVLLSTLARNRAALASTVDQLSGLNAVTGQRESELSATVARLPAGLRSLRLSLDTLRSSLPRLDTFVRATRPATTELAPTLRQLQPTLIVARPALQQASKLIRHSPEQLRALAPLLAASPPMFGTLTAVLRRSLVMLDYARVYAPEIAGVLTSWASMTGDYDALGHVYRILATVKPPKNAVTPLDSIAPGFIPPPFTRAPGSLVGTPWDNFSDSFLSGKKKQR
jgi:phospholipid/cholesterol/gamma-HCH transport system substrate-binding protein